MTEAGGNSTVDYRTDPIPGFEDATMATIALNRPDQLNAMSWDMIRAFDAAVSEADTDRCVRTVFVTGRGRAFSAGGDLEGYLDLQRDAARFPEFVTDLHVSFGRLRKLRVPAVALVNGVTAAGGLELLLNCDFAIAGESARIGDGHLNFGQMGGGGVLTLLSRMIGIQRAVELVMSGRLLDARTAAEWGLVSRVVPDGELADAGAEFAASVAAKSPLAVANAKEMMNHIWAEGLSVSAGLQVEKERNSYYCLTAQDATEGLAAFRDKRTPRFTGT